MQLENRFEIPMEIGQAWDLLLDVERVVPCFPGASVIAVAGDTIDGAVRIKLGPVLLHYAGTATFVEKDGAGHRAVLKAEGSDRKGGGSAAATITATLHALGERSTECRIVTDLDITGRPAQFGRGIMTEVGNRITAKFAANLSEMLMAPRDSGAAVDGEPVVEGVAAAPQAARPAPQPEALDLMQLAGGETAKRLLPVAAAFIAGLVLSRLARRTKGRAASCCVHSLARAS